MQTQNTPKTPSINASPLRQKKNQKTSSSAMTRPQLLRSPKWLASGDACSLTTSWLTIGSSALRHLMALSSKSERRSTPPRRSTIWFLSTDWRKRKWTSPHSWPTSRATVAECVSTWKRTIRLIASSLSSSQQLSTLNLWPQLSTISCSTGVRVRTWQLPSLPNTSSQTTIWPPSTLCWMVLRRSRSESSLLSNRCNLNRLQVV